MVLHPQGGRDRRPGSALGPVGGRIVAEVLVGLLQKDPNSYLYLHPSWKPELPIAPGGQIHHGRSPQVRGGLVLTNEELEHGKGKELTCKSDREQVTPPAHRPAGPAAVMALAAVLTLGACKATGGGYIDARAGWP